MNLFLRLLMLVIRTRFAKRTHVNDEHALSFRVWLGDQDMLQHMTNSRYLSFSDLAMIDFLMRTDMWRRLRKQGLHPLVAYKDIRMLRMLRFPQKFEVRTRMVGWIGPYVGMQHEFTSRGRVTATSLTIGRFIGKSKRPTLDELRISMGYDDVVNPEPSEELVRLVALLEAENDALKATKSTGAA
ncbi:MAG: thioesterase family protein [Pseudomonadota bacterium]